MAYTPKWMKVMDEIRPNRMKSPPKPGKEPRKVKQKAKPWLKLYATWREGTRGMSPGPIRVFGHVDFLSLSLSLLSPCFQLQGGLSLGLLATLNLALVAQNL